MIEYLRYSQISDFDHDDKLCVFFDVYIRMRMKPQVYYWF